MLIKHKFQALTALGNYASALRHYVRFKKITDSVLNTNQAKQLAEMSVKYETPEKEKAIKDLQSKEQQAMLLHQVEAAELQKIKLQRDVQQPSLQKMNLEHDMQESQLRNARVQQQLQRTELQKTALQRDFKT